MSQSTVAEAPPTQSSVKQSFAFLVVMPVKTGIQQGQVSNLPLRLRLVAQPRTVIRRCPE
jgi:hypothetical protein